MTSTHLEVHSHSYVSGPLRSFDHAHTDGATPHQHPDTGPACYVIDTDAWLAATGATGGGRKKYRARPVGPRLERVELEDWQRGFVVVLCDGRDPRDVAAQPAVARMVLGHGLEFEVVSEAEWTRRRDEGAA